jgi:D-alanine--D-alanine ligase
MARTKVGILRGGTSSEYELSLKTGAAMMKALPEDHYDTRDIFIDRAGIWHLRGSAVSSARALEQLDVVVNALHGGMGEDGTVQRFLDTTGIPYTGSGAMGAASSLNKIRTHEIMESAGIRMPHFVAFSLEDRLTTAAMARNVFACFGPPYVVKPPREGASMGIAIAHDISALPDTIGDVIDRYGSALVEEYIRGDHVSTAVVEGFRNESLYAFPPAHQRIHPDVLETNKKNARVIQHEHHTQGGLIHTIPAPFVDSTKSEIAEMARSAHQALGMEHFSRADFIRTPRATYLLEVNAVPGLYDGASLPPMLESVGSSVGEFLEHLIYLARKDS